MKYNESVFLRKIGDMSYLQFACESQQEEGKMVFLNETGTFLWEKIIEDYTEKDLVQALTTEYDVQEEQAKIDVKAFLVFLEENGCLLPEEND